MKIFELIVLVRISIYLLLQFFLQKVVELLHLRSGRLVFRGDVGASEFLLGLHFVYGVRDLPVEHFDSGFEDCDSKLDVFDLLVKVGDG